MRPDNNRPKKILLIADHINQLHGSALSAIDVLRSIPDEYHKFLLSPCTPKSSIELKGAFPTQALRQIFIKYKLGRLLPRGPVSRAISFIDSCAAAMWIYGHSFDLIIVNGYGSVRTWSRIKKLIARGIKTVVISRESPRHFNFGDVHVSLAQQIEFLRSFSCHIFVSKTLMSEWQGIAGLAAEHCYYLPNCCEESAFLALPQAKDEKQVFRSRLNISEKPILLLNVGTIEARKGQDDLLALAMRLENKRLNYLIACVGSAHTDQGRTIEDLIRASSVREKFLFSGDSYSVSDWFGAADMLVFTSRAEAMPRTILEAMASALPIVSTDVDGIPELIRHGFNGYSYHPEDIEALEKFVTAILNNDLSAKEMGRNARETYAGYFSQAQHATNTKQILAQILDNPE